MSRAPRRLFAFLFWLCVDRFGTVVGINLLCLLLCLPVITIPLALAGGAHVCRLLIQDREASSADFWAGIRHFWLKSYLFCFLMALLWLWFFVAMAFYSGFPIFWMTVGVGVALGFAVFVTVFAFWAVPMVFSELPWKTATGKALRRGLTQPKSTLLFLFVLALGKFLLALSGAGIFLVGFLWPLLLAFYADAEITGKKLEERRGWKNFLTPHADR